MGYARPKQVAEALSLLAERHWTILAGGTDLYPATTAQQLNTDVLDIGALTDLQGIRRTPAGWRIGARTSWSTLARADLPPAFRALQQAAVEVGGIQIQNAGTLGGNLCNASPAADGVPALMVLDARVELQRADGARAVPLDRFLTGPRQTALAPDELLTGILIPDASARGASGFCKLGARRYLVISIAMAAARLDISDGRITAAALAVGACSAVAQRLPEAEAALIGMPVASAADAIVADHVTALAPIDDVRGTADYRRGAAAQLVRRAVSEALS